MVVLNQWAEQMAYQMGFPRLKRQVSVISMFFLSNKCRKSLNTMLISSKFWRA